MSKTNQSIKHLQITKSQSVILLSAALAAFLLVFSAVASKSLVDQILYNNKVISAKKSAVSTLRKNVDTSEQLVNSYKAFVGTSQNLLGGNPQGTGPRDGDNSRITLNALPSKYDFPAVTTSIEKMVVSQNLQISSITGNDDEVAQSENASSPDPEPIDMPFEMAVTGGYGSVRNLIDVFDKSIRPFQVETMQLAGNESTMTMSMTGKTFYQPAKNFNMTKKVIKQ
jgi:hypothetical protein